MTDKAATADSAALSELETIKSKLAAYIDDELHRRQPVYLSALGVAMQEELSRVKALTGQTVGVLIEKEFSGRYQIARLGPHKNILALYKLGQEPTSVDPTSVEKSPGSKGVLFTRQLWLAFAVPITTPYRYIDLKTLSFSDAEQSVAPDGWILIDREYLREATDVHDPKLIAQNIVTWCAKNGVDPTLYLLKQKAPASDHIAGRSVLEMMLSTLDRRQLQSVSLPLDVVDALLRSRS